MAISKNLTNEQSVLVALWYLQGEKELVDIEDIAIAADEVTPGRFRWRKYPEHINIQHIGKALRDAKHNGHASGTSAKGWMLTEVGLKSARELVPSAGESAPRRAISAQEKAWIQRERVRLLSEIAFQKSQGGDFETITERELLRFFRLDEYVTGETRRARIARITHSFSDDADLAPVIRTLAEKVPL